MPVRKYKDWYIETVGGHITIKRFEAEKGDKFDPKSNYQWHWAFKLKDCKEICDKRNRGEEVKELYLKSLY